jgi:hypothetical protein
LRWSSRLTDVHSSAAYLLSVEGNRTPAQLQARIKALATQNALSGLDSGPNALAFNGIQRGSANAMMRLKRSTIDLTA